MSTHSRCSLSMTICCGSSMRPFDVEGDRRLMATHGMEVVVCKNAGGSGAQAKLGAARALGLPVIMIDRPVLPARLEAYAAEDVLRWLDHGADRGV